MKKKSSVAQAVLNYVAKEPNVTTSTVVKNVIKPVNQIHTAIWKLVRAGKLTKDANGVLRVSEALPMTALRPNVPIVIDKISGDGAEKISRYISKRKATGMEMHLANKLRKAEDEVAVLKRDLTQMSVNYYDALAVIKYLESKKS